MKRLLTGSAAALALTMSAGMGFAQEGGEGGQGEGAATTFDFFANAGDNEVAYTDFNKAFDESGMYDDFDTDDDGMLSREEYNRGVFSRYDRDANDMLDAEEMGVAGDDDFFGLGD